LARHGTASFKPACFGSKAQSANTTDWTRLSWMVCALQTPSPTTILRGETPERKGGAKLEESEGAAWRNSLNRGGLTRAET